MKLFQLSADLNEYCVFRPNPQGIYAWSNLGGDWLFDGVSRGGAYPAVKGKRDVGKKKNGTLPDFTYFNLQSIPTFSSHAIDALGELLNEHGEFTPTIQMDEPIDYKAFNPTTIFDCLDENRSELERFPTGRIFQILKYELLPMIEALPPIFKIPQVQRGYVYVNQDFVNRAEGLRGFEFIELFER